MAIVIRSNLISFLDIIFYELVIVLTKLLKSCTQLLTNTLLASNQYLSMYLDLLYVMGLATDVSIQLDLTNPSPKFI